MPPVVISGDDVAHNKPAPDGYLEAARRLSVAPSRALVVEDTAAGIAAGVAAGCDVLAMLHGRPLQFARAATYAVDDLTKLRLLVKEGAVRLELEGRKREER
ncbi:MAG TPA: HAD-IA family hydrolase, partial [Candidatus Tumulicola sp.]|nr:HAD-IA family hydrolase [Candidatus Tumulicola sp.]